ncbi:hypothetical protein [Lysinibacillus pakistanensis]|uniref:hypothetical protein n=1 Tax=Lysinibacillus pakistanensis TaxID=759811 RepID=UPI003D2E5428
MKFPKLLSASALTLALFGTSVAPAFANEPSKTVETSSITTMDQLDKRFNLQAVDEVPEGVIPLEFNSIEEAAKYLEQGRIGSNQVVSNNISELQVQPFSNGETITKIGKFKTTNEAELHVFMSFSRLNGRVDLTALSTKIVGGGSWSWPQSSYKTQYLDGGRSLGIYISGTLRQTIAVNGVIRVYDFPETVYVEI